MVMLFTPVVLDRFVVHLVRQLVRLVDLMDRVDYVRATSRTLFHALTPVVSVGAEPTSRIVALVSPEVRLLGLRGHAALVEHLGVLRKLSFNMLRLLVTLTLMDEARAGASGAARSCRVRHLTLADRLIVELPQPVSVRLEPVLTCLAFIVAELLLVSLRLQAAGRLAEHFDATVEEAGLGDGRSLVHLVQLLVRLPAVGLLQLVVGRLVGGALLLVLVIDRMWPVGVCV